MELWKSYLSFIFHSSKTHSLFHTQKRIRSLKMWRQGTRFISSRASAASVRWSRQFSTDLPAETAGDSKFIESWKKVMPNMDPPKTPSAYMTHRPPTPATIPTKLTVNLVLPYDSILSGKEVLAHYTYMLAYLRLT